MYVYSGDIEATSAIGSRARGAEIMTTQWQTHMPATATMSLYMFTQLFFFVALRKGDMW